MTEQTQTERKRATLIFIGTYYGGKKKSFGFVMAGENNGDPVDDAPILYFGSTLVKAKITPGALVEVEYAGDPAGAMTIYGRSFVGRWKCQEQVIKWQVQDDSRLAVKKKADVEAEERTTDELRRALAPVRAALFAMSPTRRRAVLGWIMDYLLS